MELVTVASLPNSIDAHLMRTLLEAEGIPASVANEQISNTFLPLETAIGGVQLQVRAEDVEAAQRIIEKMSEDELADNEEAEPEI